MPTMAASMAGTNPPTRATTTTASRNTSTSLVRLSRRGRRDRASGQQRQRAPRPARTRRSAARSVIGRRGTRQPAAAAHLRVRDDVHVDVAGAADGPGRRCRGPVSIAREPRPAARAEHELSRVLGAGELEQRRGDVVADDLVVGAAERLDQPPLAGQRGRVGAGQAVRLADVHREQVAAGARAAIRAARRISVSPSGPPVSATTTRSRVSQVSSMLVLVRYRCSPSSTLSASHSSASSRSAVRLPTRK